MLIINYFLRKTSFIFDVSILYLLFFAPIAGTGNEKTVALVMKALSNAQVGAVGLITGLSQKEVIFSTTYVQGE